VQLVVSELPGPGPDEREVDLVERKGLGHPDSLCDALAEQLSLDLSRFYLERFGSILHHNVDKALLWGGASRPAFGGGQVLAPMELFLAGRAATELRGERVPVAELMEAGVRGWLREHLHALDVERHLRTHCLVRPGSADLVDLFARGGRLANDTSFGVGYAPPSGLERLVADLEGWITAPATTRERPEVGEDVKILAVRRGDVIRLTVACAVVDQHVARLDEYLDKRESLARAVRERASRATRRAVEVIVNAADDPARESVYLTVTGTSAESGDDGQAGRGNRANGLIAPCRPMTLESVAGKNPVTHVGKLYNLAAGLLAQALVDGLPEVAEAECYLVSQIGAPVAEPRLAHLRLRCGDGRPPGELAARAGELAREELGRVEGLWQELVEGRLATGRWPLRRAARGGAPAPRARAPGRRPT
jgi:S-adenosylmethionine synthetase